MTMYEELKARGLVAQITDEVEVPNLINNGEAVFYIGFDPTADSLHVGHFMALCLMKRLQMAGNKPIALVGGGTGMVGDPSGRQDLRNMMTVETIDANCEAFKRQMARFIDFGDHPVRPRSHGDPGDRERVTGEPGGTPVSEGGLCLPSEIKSTKGSPAEQGSVGVKAEGSPAEQGSVGAKAKGSPAERSSVGAKAEGSPAEQGSVGVKAEGSPADRSSVGAKAIMVNNADWLRDLNYLEFLRDVGPHFSVNRMLTAECYKNRMEKGLTFLEFNYMIMQAYDFYELFRRYGCNMQFGGNDQWSNMLAGTELIRRKLAKDAHVLTITLLLNSEGDKMGKTAKGAVWLDKNKTGTFEFYQYWRNVADADVIKCMKLLTFLPLEQIAEMESWRDRQINDAKEILAYEMTALVHGADEAEAARATARELFASGGAADMPETELAETDLTDSRADILTLLHKSGLCASRSDARRAVEQGGVEADGEKIADIAKTFGAEELRKGIVVRRGKKNYRRVILK